MAYIKNQTKTFIQLLEERKKFVIPEYQRKFEWEDNNFTSLVEELISIQDNEKSSYDKALKYENPALHDLQSDSKYKKMQIFMGNIVLHGNNIVDGQQRLTSLMIIMKAIQDLVKEKKMDLDKNHFVRTCNSYLTPIVAGKKYPMIESKVVTQNGINSAFLGITSSKIGKYKISKLHKKAKEIINKKNDIYSIIDIVAFKILSIQFIILDVDTIEDSFDIFEKLNSKSTPLKPADLIKNKVISITHDQDKHNNIFVDIMENIGDTDETTFYRIALMIKKGIEANDEKSAKDAYLRKSSLYNDEFSNEKEHKNIIDKIYFIKELSKTYKKYFIDKNSENYMNNLLLRFFDLKRVKVLSTITLFLSHKCEEGKISTSDLHLSAIWLENYFIGMFSLNNNPAKEVDKIVPKLIYHLNKAISKTSSSAQIIKIMQDSLLSEYNKEDRERVYDLIKNKTFSNSVAMHLLNKLYDEYDEKKNERRKILGSVHEILRSYAISVEHLLPQKPTKWCENIEEFSKIKPKKADSIDTDEDIYKLIYKIGNMFILGKHKNISLGNGTIVDKIDKLNNMEENEMEFAKDIINRTIYIENDPFSTKAWLPIHIKERTKIISKIFEDNELLKV